MTGSRDSWLAWKEQTFGTGYEIWHEGLDVAAVTDLAGPAREEAVRMLALGLSNGDGHAATALAAMGETSAVAALAEALRHPEPGERVRIALALHALAPDPALAEVLVEVLRGAPTWSARIDAAIGLRRFGTPDGEPLAVTGPLLQAVGHDPDALVRYHAAESTLALRGIRPAAITAHRAVFDLLRGDAPDGWRDAAEGLRTKP